MRKEAEQVVSKDVSSEWGVQRTHTQWIELCEDMFVHVPLYCSQMLPSAHVDLSTVVGRRCIASTVQGLLHLGHHDEEWPKAELLEHLLHTYMQTYSCTHVSFIYGNLDLLASSCK